MAGKPGQYSLRAKQYLAKYPAYSSSLLAKLLYKDFPLVYNNSEDARKAIRRLRGANGVKDRPQQIAPPSPFSSLLGRIPKGVVIRDTTPYRIEGVSRLLVFGDAHIPYHVDPAIKAMLRYANEVRVKGILINGDLIDNHFQSKHQKDPHARDFKEEADTTRKFLELLRDMFPSLPIWYKFGNHEERHEHYLYNKCPEIFDHPHFQLDYIFGLKDLNIQVIRYKRRVMFGDLVILHGHEYRTSFVQPVNPARGIYLRAKAHALANHFHQDSKHTARDIHGNSVACWTMGCLCDLNPLFHPYNEWSHGFAICDLLDARHFTVSIKHIGKRWKVD